MESDISGITILGGSSVGQSVRLITERSAVQTRLAQLQIAG